jgi:hypothetical protein
VFDAQGKLWLDEYKAAATEEEIEKIKERCSEVRAQLRKAITSAIVLLISHYMPYE